ncbi:MAG: hypothetical protein ACXVAX_04550 [Pseudobdellovibrio sp.]
MKKIFFIALIVLAQNNFAQNKTANPTVSDKSEKETNLAADKTVLGKGFSVAVPKGWSYINGDHSAKPMESKLDNVVTRVSTGDLTMAPDSNIGESPTYFSVRDFAPKAPDIANLYKKYKKAGATLTTAEWNGSKWDILEYKLTYLDLDKKNKTAYNWYATTHLKDHDLTIMAGTPSLEKRDQYRAQFELTMKTVKVVE